MSHLYYQLLSHYISLANLTKLALLFICIRKHLEGKHVFAVSHHQKVRPAKIEFRSTGWNHNIHYHDLILRAVPSPCDRALDAGCGQGFLTRQLATRAKTFVGIDLDLPPNPSAPPNTTFLQGDVMTHPFPPASFDFIAAVATLHHLPLHPALARFRDLLAPGGVLAILGLYRPVTLADHALAAAALPPAVS